MVLVVVDRKVLFLSVSNVYICLLVFINGFFAK